MDVVGNKMLLATVLVAIALVMIIVQTVQLAYINDKLSTLELSLEEEDGSDSSNSSSSATVPTMVGGC